MGMGEFARDLALSFAAALGMVVGGALAGGFVSLLTGGLPLETMDTLSRRLKLWATVASVGGALVAFQTLESGFVEGELRFMVRQLILICVAFAGAHLGQVLVAAVAGKG